jgi:Domain of unknown function (DUF4136)
MEAVMNRMLIVLACVVALGGCAGTPRLSADVQSFAQWPAVPQATTYKFERTPSQSSGQAAEAQARLEQLAKPSLAKLNWQEAPNGAAATHTVALQWRAQRVDDPLNPWFGFGFGMGRDYVVTRGGQIVWLPLGPRADWPTTAREVQIIVRDVRTAAVVFESSAKHESRASDDSSIAGLLIDAALDGFPTPASGVRRVAR